MCVVLYCDEMHYVGRWWFNAVCRCTTVDSVQCVCLMLSVGRQCSVGVFDAVRRCTVVDSVQLVCADETTAALRVSVLTNKSTVFNTVRLPVSTTLLCCHV